MARPPISAGGLSEQDILWIDIVTGLTPVVSDLRDVVEAVSGWNVIELEPLSGTEHTLTTGGVFLPVVGATILRRAHHWLWIVDETADAVDVAKNSTKAVANMGEFFQSKIGKTLKAGAQKSSQQFQGQSIYKAKTKIGANIKKGDQFYLDGMHKDHLEVFDKKGNFKLVLNLDGSINVKKTKAGLEDGRILR